MSLTFACLPLERGIAQEVLGLPTSEYCQRRERLMSEVQDGVVVLFGARDEDFSEFVKFRQKNDFIYLTGAERPGAILLLAPKGWLGDDQESREIVFLPPRDPFTESWEGPQDNAGPESEQKFGLKEVIDLDQFFPRLISVLTGDDEASGRERPKVYTHVAGGSMPELTWEHYFAETLRRIVPGVQIEDVAQKIAEQRLVKSPGEVALLQRAIDITIEAQRDVARAIRPGAMEYEAQAALEAAFTRNGAERPGFFSIVGAGKNATILHYHANRGPIAKGDLVVVDIGAEFHYYTADITRTFPASGTFTPRQREIYQLVLDAQRAFEAAFQLGESTIGHLHRAAAACMRESPLRDSEGQTLDRHFRHGVGHGLGMDVHDVGRYDAPLPVGAVFTIEPGIYLPDENIGVRIEDDYLVTENGIVKLSKALPSEPDDVERMMRGETTDAPERADAAQEASGAP